MMHAESFRHPLVVEWYRDSQAQRDAGLGRTTRSAMLAAGEQMVVSLGLRMLPATYNTTKGYVPIEDEPKGWLAESVRSAACYWIPKDLDRMVRGMPLPRHRVGKRELPHRLMWICPEMAHGPDNLTVDSLLLRVGESADGRAGLQGWMIGEDSEATDPGWAIHPLFVPWGASYPSATLTEDSFGALVLKLLAFLDSPYTDTPRQRASRTERRALEKAGYEEPTVHIVRLRTPIRSARESGESGQSDREYRHRWWVRGHFRAQWYPSHQAHQVMWIAPHVKGPDGAEFKASTYAVVR